MVQISRLTPEQDAVIPLYQQKWQQNLLETKAIDAQKAIAAIHKIYALMGLKQPEVRFFASPNQIKHELINQPPEVVSQELGSPVFKPPFSFEILNSLQKQIEPQLWQQLNQELEPNFQPMTLIWQELELGLASQISETESQKWLRLWQQLAEQQWSDRWQISTQWIRSQVKQLPAGDIFLNLSDTAWQNFGQFAWQQIGEPITQGISQQTWMQELEDFSKQLSLPWLQMSSGIGLMSSLLANIDFTSMALLDYCIEVLDCEHNQEQWLATRSMAQECGLVFFFHKTCLVCHRPKTISLDEQYRLHGVGKPAIAYPDGDCIYAYHGVILPPKYGRLHPNLWQAQWLLTEPNAELRRVLIQGIGYGRICQELQAIELDSWREYTLLRIEQNIDIEPIHLLKMTCPSTNQIHAARVPPHIYSAQEAITWMNWNVHPEDFAVET